MNLGEGDTLIAVARNAEAGDGTDEVNTDPDAV
jgi:DNA gyrase subunit A